MSTCNVIHEEHDLPPSLSVTNELLLCVCVCVAFSDSRVDVPRDNAIYNNLINSK